jgi:hypothetical protein
LPLNTRCYTRLIEIPHKHWADYAFPAPRYGQRTSNLVEQQNHVYLQPREMPILDMCTAIWKDTYSARSLIDFKLPRWQEAHSLNISTPCTNWTTIHHALLRLSLPLNPLALSTPGGTSTKNSESSLICQGAAALAWLFKMIRGPVFTHLLSSMSFG